MPLVQANSINTYYEDTGGDGEPVVLIHGHSIDLRMWPSQTLALREAGYRVIRYDVRGHGRSDAPDSGYTWPVYAEDLVCLLDTLDIGTAHLAGFSMGGGIALQFALDHPGRTKSLTLIDAAVPGFAYSEAFAATIEALVEAVREHGWREAAESIWLHHPMFDGLRGHPAAFEVVRDIVLEFRAPDYLVDAEEPQDPEAVERLDELRPPLLVLVGEDDLEDFRLAAELVAGNAPRARLETVSGAGHMLPLERPAEVNKRLLAFLADPESVPSRPEPVLAIRPATVDDVPAIAGIDSTFPTRRVLELDRRGLAPSLTFDFSLKERDADTTHANAEPAAYWHEHLRDGDTVLVATRDGVVAGAIVLQEWDFNRTLWIADIRVQPAHRRHGVGRALMDAAVERARERKLVSLRLETQSDNIDAVQFYLKYGFRFSGFDDRLYLHQHPNPEQDNRIALFFTLPLPGAAPVTA